MDAIVLIQFRDKYTQQIYLPGDKFTGSNERVKELSEFLEVIPVKEVDKPVKEKK